MKSKSTITIAVVAVAAFALWRLAGGKGGTADTAVENAKAGVAEAVLPEIGNPDATLVIRKAMLEQRKRENTEWTPANIQAHPDLYIEHCRKMLDGYSAQYGAAILETKTAIHRNEREIAAAEEEGAAYLGFLKAAKAALSDDAAEFPSKVGAYTYGSADQVRSAVVKTDAKLSERESFVAAKKAANEELATVFADLEKDKEKVDRERQDLTVKKEQVQSGALRSQTDGIRSRIDALLGGVDAISDIENAAPVPGRAAMPAVSAEDVFTRRGID